MPFNNIISRADAQALIPEDVSREIWKNVPQQSAALSSFRQRRLSRNQQRLPVLSVLPLAYFVNGDTGLKQTTEVNWDNKYLNVEEIACIVPIPENVLDDADYDIWGETRPLIEEAIGRTLDAAIFFSINKPSSWPTAIVPAAIAAGNTVALGTSTTAQGGIAGDFSELFGTLEDDGFDAGMVAAKRSLKKSLRNARDTQGQKLSEAVTRMMGQVSVDSIYGVDVKYPMRGLWPNGAGSALAIAGDAQHGIIGVRQDISVKLLTEATIVDNAGAIVYALAQQDMVALRVVFRVAWQVPNPISYDKPTESERYPFAVLTS